MNYEMSLALFVSCVIDYAVFHLLGNDCSYIPCKELGVFYLLFTGCEDWKEIHLQLIAEVAQGKPKNRQATVRGKNKVIIYMYLFSLRDMFFSL